MEYKIEYSNLHRLYLTAVITGVLFCVGFGAALYLINDLLLLMVGIFLHAALMALFFVKTAKSSTQKGSVLIAGQQLTFILAKRTVSIPIPQIRNYYIDRRNGVHLRLITQKNKWFEVTADYRYCDPKSLEKALEIIETVVAPRLGTRVKRPDSRPMPSLKKKWYFLFLIFWTLGLVGSFAVAVLQNEHRYWPLVVVLGLLISLWFPLYEAAKKNKI